MAVDEAKKPVAVDKNFDFLILTKSKAYVVDVKGKQIPYKGGSGFLWETWIHQKDLTGLRQWENMLKPLFRCNVESLIAYVYWIKEAVFLQDFGTVKYRGKEYGIKAITISEFEKNKETRGGFLAERQVWQLPRKHARNLLKDFNFFLSA